MYICAMKNAVKKYLDNIFAARSLPTIAWGAFQPHLIACIKADGGTWNELHRYFELPLTVTGAYELVDADEIFKYLYLYK